MEEEARQAVEDAEAWALLGQARQVEEALRRREVPVLLPWRNLWLSSSSIQSDRREYLAAAC
jgi:hypothetical protein